MVNFRLKRLKNTNLWNIIATEYLKRLSLRGGLRGGFMKNAEIDPFVPLMNFQQEEL